MPGENGALNSLDYAMVLILLNYFHNLMIIKVSEIVDYFLKATI